MSKNTTVTASEIGDFVFCKRGWWLRQNRKLSEPTEAMIEGKLKHESLARHIEMSKTIQILSLTFFVLGLLCSLLLLVKLCFFP
ncbi:hypothetical protein HGA88_06995 [Candidatus Roizmanbacteria bacterium]|nr:hypothetical protein [Candidatus Roizmanbacteria bacterium]